MIVRPVLRVQGGKFRLVRWLLNFFPAHERYVEPFGGAASVLLQKPRSTAEVYNDIDEQLVNVFRVLRRSRDARELHRRLLLTPYARAEFEASFSEAEDLIDAARQTIVRSFMGHGSDAITRRCRAGFRDKLVDAGVLPASDWSEYEKAIAGFVERMRGVEVENTNALALIRRMDSPDTLFYVDPPPVPEPNDGAADKSHGLRFPMEAWDHGQLACVLHQLRGMVVLSGTPCELLNEAYSDWCSYSNSRIGAAGLRTTEAIWLNAAAANALDAGPRPGRSLFEASGA